MEFTEKLIRSSKHLSLAICQISDPSSSGSQDIVLTRFSIAIMAESKMRHSFAILGPTKKCKCSLIVCAHAINKISSL